MLAEKKVKPSMIINMVTTFFRAEDGTALSAKSTSFTFFSFSIISPENCDYGSPKFSEP